MERETIGPLKVINRRHPKQKFESLRHRCSAAFFEWTENEAREIVLRHLDIAHINPIVWKPNAR